ncbi:BT0820 family HAD-type phosphatase [Persicobacter psychrovividus]|uniref:Hydrolase n=1 Tax=Persicobacter psychrovividus TaxID=387638 RepID=A0ABN6L8B2_9BACT|nr:hypothetical protein PEPS_16390 [Persicobacter psychrovividus]
MKIAIDFDGTIVEDAYPEIGRPMMFAFETMKELQKQGHQLVLWTYRRGQPLRDAVAFCEEHGINFYAVNESYPGESMEGISRKIDAEIFIDDRNIGGFLGWSKVWELLNADQPEMHFVDFEAHQNYKQEKSFWRKIFG